MNSQIVGYKTRWSDVGVFDTTISPIVGAHDLLVKISYIALNPIDIKKKTLAFVPRVHAVGKEFSGTVEKVGSALGLEWKTGDRICGYLNTSSTTGSLGSLAVINVNLNTVMKSPFNLDDMQSAAFPLTFSTAFEMLERTWKRGKLLVLGGGTNVGSYIIQLAKDKYMFTDIVATCSEKSAGFVSSLGAVTIDYNQKDLSSALVALKTKFDAVLDTVGGYDALQVWPKILKCYKDGGVYVTIAGDAHVSSYSSGIILPMMTSLPWMVPRLALGRQLGINYQFISKKSSSWTREAAEFFSKNDSKIRIASQYSLQDCLKAWSHVNNLKGGGKVLIQMSTNIS